MGKCIISILLGDSMPSIKALGSGLILHMQAVQLAQDIRYTQHLALTHREKYKLVLYVDENSYNIRLQSPIKSPIKKVELCEGVYIRYSTLAGSGDYRYIEFNYKTGLPGRTGTIYLADHYGNTKNIVLCPLQDGENTMKPQYNKGITYVEIVIYLYLL